MKLHPMLAALALCCGAAQAQTQLDDTLAPPPARSVPLSAFEAIQPPPDQDSVPLETASEPMAAVRLRIDPKLSAPPPLAAPGPDAVPPPPVDEKPAEPPAEAN